MVVDDVYRGFLETLDALSPTKLTPVEAILVFKERVGNVKTFVAVIPESGRVVGTASLLIERKFLHGGRRVGHIEDVAVHPGHQGQRIGQRLIDHLLQSCVTQNCYKAVLNCDSENISFYKKLGFNTHDYGMRVDFT